jgi:hypothetical protein
MFAYQPFIQPQKDAALIEQHLGSSYRHLHCDGEPMTITCLGLATGRPVAIVFRKISAAVLEERILSGSLTKVQRGPARYVH